MERTHRRLAVLDLLILVAALAVAYGLHQAYLRMPGQWFQLRDLVRPTGRGGLGGTVWRAFLALAHFGGPPAGALTVALPVVRLRTRRTEWRRAAREPGFAACLGAATGAAFAGAGVALLFVAGGGLSGRTWYAYPKWIDHFVYQGAFTSAGVAVASVWLAQVVAGHWRPMPDPIDRLGRAVGLYWIATGIVATGFNCEHLL